MKPERRFINQEFRVSEDATPTIAGYAAVFDTPSVDMGWTEEIDPHAFDAVLATNPDVRSLFNHDPNFVIGRTAANTLSLSVDSRGLAYVATPPQTQWANDLIVSMRRKDITGSSFGFICSRDQWTDNPDGTVTRRILEIGALLDASPVTFPAFPAASSGVRSLPDSMPVEIRSRFEIAETRSMTDQCTCPCPQCLVGSCGICSADPQCLGATRPEVKADSTWKDDALLRIRLAEAL